jgi:Siphovirus ReqiPepy6 Gp37-like protein
MKVFKLDSSHLPSTSLDSFKSFIWTERYLEPGDFQIDVEDDISILTTFPIGCLISHSDTHEVMIVEDHEIQRNKNKKLIVTVTGRSFEVFSENRATTVSSVRLSHPADPTQPFIETMTSSAENVAKYQLDEGLCSGSAAADDVVANVITAMTLRVEDSSMTHFIKRGLVYNYVIELLKIANAGIKTVRPNGGQTTLNLVIHDGLDLTQTVIFYAQSEDLNDAKYLWSIKNYKNYAQIAAHETARLYKHKDVAGTPTGLNRRTMYVEADKIYGSFEPPSATDSIAATAQGALDEHKMISLLQATVSMTAKPKFKINYDVGDLVTVFGEFSTQQTMRVTEHILTIDEKGMRGFPALSTV